MGFGHPTDRSVRKTQMNSIPASSTTTTMSSSAPYKRVAKKTTAPVAAVATPEPVAAPVAAAAATTAPAPKAKRASKAVASEPVAAVASEPVAAVAAAEVPAPVADASAAVVESSWNEDLVSVTTNLSTMRETLTTLLTQVKRLEKKVARTVKDAGKRRKARKVDENGVEVPKRPTVFNVPQTITDDLNVFLDQAKGTQMSRAQVTKAVTGYAKAHKLMEGHNINADAGMTRLLNPSANLKEGERLNIFNLQRCLRHHYVKSAPATTATPATTA